MRPTTNVTRTAATVAVLALLSTGCGTEGTPASAPPASSTEAVPSPTSSSLTPTRQPVPDGLVDVPSLPRGEDTEVDHVVDQTVHLDGRAIATDLPADAAVGIMGVVDDLVVLTGVVGNSLPRWWSLDPSGHATRLGDGDYDTYSYAPVLVEETGHLWLNYDDRGTGAVTIWALDVRSGDELFELHDDEAPPPLEPADQAVYDLFADRGEAPPEPPVTSPDGTLVAKVAEDVVDGDFRDRLVVRRGDEVVTEVRFAMGSQVSDRDERLLDCPDPDGDCYVSVLVGSPRFEDDDHVLVLAEITVSDSNNALDPVSQSAIVRCDLTGACELATDLAGSVSLRDVSDSS